MKKESKSQGACAGSGARIAPSYRPDQVLKTAPCQQGCANCGDIRAWIGTVAQRRKTGIDPDEAYARAWRIIADVNPFPATLGRICPHPCESHCNRSELDEPLAINALERFLGDYAIESRLPLPSEPGTEAVESIGVVGAGPSGLSFAYQMARWGYPVTVYDAREKAGGMLRYGVPDYRLPQRVLDAEIDKIIDLGVSLELNTQVGRDISLETLQQRHACLYLGIGAQKGRGLDVPGIDGPGILQATEYLEQLNRGEDVPIGTKVAVIGGGNTAMDAARCARRSGADVTVLYRRTLDEMPAIKSEIEEAVEESVELLLLAAPVGMLRDSSGRLVAVEVQNMKLGGLDASGRPRPVPVEGSCYSLEADTVILAVSQVPELNGFSHLDNKSGWLVADGKGAINGKLWTGGDVLGLGIAGQAIVQGRHAAERLHEQLRGLPVRVETPATCVGAKNVTVVPGRESRAARQAGRPPAERVVSGMSEVTETICEQRFLSEVERCLSCGSCFGCEQCYMYCTSGCYKRVESAAPGAYFSLNLDACQECGKCVEVCPCGYLEVR